MSAYNIFKPRQMFRSATSRNTSDTIGLCFTVKGDFVGEFGAHVGHEIVLTTAETNKHSEMALFSGLGQARRRMTPRQMLSIWPRPVITR